MHGEAAKTVGSRCSVSRDRAREPKTEDVFRRELLTSLFRKTRPISKTIGITVYAYCLMPNHTRLILRRWIAKSIRRAERMLWEQSEPHGGQFSSENDALMAEYTVRWRKIAETHVVLPVTVQRAVEHSSRRAAYFLRPASKSGLDTSRTSDDCNVTLERLFASSKTTAPLSVRS
jgi:REP element-mobilizing transposase RayT